MIDTLVTTALFVSIALTALSVYVFYKYLKINKAKKVLAIVLFGVLLFIAIMWMIINGIGFLADRTSTL